VLVGAFRADVTRAGMKTEAQELIRELYERSPEFNALWADTEVVGMSEGAKQPHHPQAGVINLEFSTFTVEGCPELAMVLCNPVVPVVANKVEELLAAATLR